MEEHFRAFSIFLLAVAFFTQNQAKMLVQSPPELSIFFEKKYAGKGIPYSIANYGVVPYGKTVSGKLGIPSVL